MTPAERELLLTLAEHAAGHPGDPPLLMAAGDRRPRPAERFRDQLFKLMSQIARASINAGKPTVTKDLPRRVHRELWSQAEHAIQAAVVQVEAMPADVRLTDAVILLGQAKSKVADYVDEHPQ